MLRQHFWSLGGITVLLLCQSHLPPAIAQTPASGGQSNVLASAAALLNNVFGSNIPTSPSTVSPSPSPTPTSTSSPTPTPTSSPTPSPTPTSSPTPQASATLQSPTAAPPPLPTNGNATALVAQLRMQGVDLWPFSNAAASALVQSLSQTLTTVTISGINVVNVTQVNQPGRKLLGANDTIDVYIELEGTSPAAALSINSDLGNNVLSGNLQRTLARNGLILQSLSLTYSNAAVPQSNVACSTGSFERTCITDLGGGLSTGAIVGIAVGAGLGALALIALCVTCILKCARKKQTTRVAREPPTKKAMTPQHAQPYWEQNQKEANRGVVSMAATPASTDEKGNPIQGGSLPGTAMSGDMYAETKEMGGRLARDQLKMKLPAFAGRTSRTTSNAGGISRTTSAVSRQNSLAGSRQTSHIPSSARDDAGLQEV